MFPSRHGARKWAPECYTTWLNAAGLGAAGSGTSPARVGKLSRVQRAEQSGPFADILPGSSVALLGSLHANRFVAVRCGCFPRGLRLLARAASRTVDSSRVDHGDPFRGDRRAALIEWPNRGAESNESGVPHRRTARGAPRVRRRYRFAGATRSAYRVTGREERIELDAGGSRLCCSHARSGAQQRGPLPLLSVHGCRLARAV